MFVKRRKVVNFNNNDVLENKNYPMINKNNILTRFCLQHKFDCNGNSEEVKIKTDFLINTKTVLGMTQFLIFCHLLRCCRAELFHLL